MLGGMGAATAMLSVAVWPFALENETVHEPAARGVTVSVTGRGPLGWLTVAMPAQLLTFALTVPVLPVLLTLTLPALAPAVRLNEVGLSAIAAGGGRLALPLTSSR